MQSLCYIISQQAEVAELADALDSKSGDLWSCGFDSHLRYHLISSIQLKRLDFFCRFDGWTKYSVQLDVNKKDSV